MVCEMGEDYDENMDIEGVPSMWPDDVGSEVEKKFTMEKPGMDQDMLQEVTKEDPSVVDFKRLLELSNYSEKGSSQLTSLVKNWEYKQSNAYRLIHEELGILNRQRQEAELKKLEILEEHRFEGEKFAGDKRPISILDEVYDILEDTPQRKNNIFVQNKKLEIDAEYDTITYWNQRAMQLEKLLEASDQREQILMEKLQENIKRLEKQSSPVEEFSQILKRADNYLHFVLQNAPVVIGHQDKELRYRFIYNHFPRLQEEDIIGKTDMEFFSGPGVKESQDFKKEVMQRGLPAKREITFETELFGSKTFLIYVEPVFSKAGDTIGVNYMGMDISDQVIKRERMATLREQIAVQKAKETELNKTIHITEETMRAKQMLATMSHEIRSPLTGVVSMAEILANSKLDREQRQLLDVMISSGDLVLQLINDILDLSKVESGVMKLEATKFRPREVVKHVLQTAAASLQKELTMEGHVAEGVPVEVVGDVLRIRQILTNLISNAVKFTHEGRVGIKLRVVPEPSGQSEGCQQNLISDQSADSMNHHIEANGFAEFCNQTCREDLDQSDGPDEGPRTDDRNLKVSDGDVENHSPASEETVWIRCDVYDTGIGIPENAIPTLFKKYMQVSADHARKYGGTGLGLAICKQLVELMGGRLTVTSQEDCGSTFTFLLPYKVSVKREPQDEPDDMSDIDEHEILSDANNDESTACFYNFQPRTLGSLFASADSTGTHKLPPKKFGYDPLNKLKHLSEKPYSFPSSDCISREAESDACSTAAIDSFSEIESSRKDPEHDESYAVCGGKPSHSNSNSIKNSALGFLHNGETCMEVDNKEKTTKHQDSRRTQDHENTSFQISSSSNNQLPKSNSKSKILLVEDNDINVMVAKSMMKRLGHEIEVVNDGVDAVRAVQTKRYDLVLMFTMEKPGMDQDMLQEVTIEDPPVVDFKHFLDLPNYCVKGSSQLASLAKNWEYKQSNACRLLHQELDILNRQSQEDELKNKRLEIDAEYDTLTYWNQRAMQLEKLLEASVQREQILMEKLQENVKRLEKQSLPVEEFSQILKRADNFLDFVLQNAPIVIGHQDKELRYRFIYNPFPGQDIIGKTEMEIFSGAGVKECQDFKKEVMQRGYPAKREITFETELFGSKTFLIYVEPVFSKAGDTIGVNYVGMDISDQVIKRERMATLQEEIAVQKEKEKETELNKTIHITEETMRAKQMLATMSHEIRSLLTGVVSMAEILANSKLDREQRQLLDVMISSGDLVLQLINDILNLSKVESGVMKLEATKFQPREVVKHVLQTAVASLQKALTMEEHVAEGVPVEVVGDAPRIRQILTNLISNAVKFTQEGRVGINLCVVPEPSGQSEGCQQNLTSDQSAVSVNHHIEANGFAESCNQTCREDLDKSVRHDEGPRTDDRNLKVSDGDVENHSDASEATV